MRLWPGGLGGEAIDEACGWKWGGGGEINNGMGAELIARGVVEGGALIRN